MNEHVRNEGVECSLCELPGQLACSRSDCPTKAMKPREVFARVPRGGGPGFRELAGRAFQSSEAAPRRDALLAAVMDKVPAGAAWSRDERVAWLRLFVLTCDVVFGPVEVIRVEAAAGGLALGNIRANPAVLLADTGAPETPPLAGHHTAGEPQETTYTIDYDGFAMCDGKPLEHTALPVTCTLYDERIGLEAGDWESIMWAKVGTVKGGAPRPSGVMLVPAARRSAKAEVTV